jgi:predicted dehydrogenase
MGDSTNRRGFLKGVAAAASFSIMARATAQGDAANARIRAGLIGLGGRGKMIGDMLQAHGGYELVAVADYFPEVARERGAGWAVPPERCHSGLLGYRRLLENQLDAVFLETPPYCFPSHVEAAVEAGLHVYMAKPVACDVPGTLRVQEAARKTTEAGRQFLIDFQTRTDPLYIEGIRRVHAGEIGALGLISSLYTDEGFPDPPLANTVEDRLQHLIWVNDNALGGGYLVNAGIHAIDVALWLAQAAPVSAVGTSRAVRAEPHGDSHDVFSLTYEFENGLLMNHRGEHLRNRFSFRCDNIAHGQEGYLETAYSGEVAMPAIRGGWGGGPVQNLYEEGARRNIDAFHERVISGSSDDSTVAPSINANLAVLLGREAAARSARVTWDQLLAENTPLEPDLSGLLE